MDSEQNLSIVLGFLVIFLFVPFLSVSIYNILLGNWNLKKLALDIFQVCQLKYALAWVRMIKP